MSVTSAIVLFAVIWFLIFLIIIPFRLKTQGDLGAIVKGTQAGAPEIQDIGGWAPGSSGVPYDGTANEEYWGIVDIDRNIKEVYNVIQSYFKSDQGPE